MSFGKVSVVIPTYNRGYCIRAAVASLQDQTYGDWEAVIVDDGSADDTRAVVLDLARVDSRIRYFRQENRGVSAARNLGLRHASGAFVAFLDSDDAWEPWKLEAQVACLRAMPTVGMVWTDMNAVNESGELVSPRHLRKMYGAFGRGGEARGFTIHATLGELVGMDVFADYPSGDRLREASVHSGDLYSSMLIGSMVHTSTVLLTTERRQAVGFFDESMKTGEDYDFHLRTCAEGDVALLDIPAIRYRIAGGEDQLTSPDRALEIALNALATREAAVGRDRRRAGLADHELDEILSFANSWVASEYWSQANFRAARRYFRRAFRLGERDWKFLVKGSIAHLPQFLAGVIAGARKKA